MKKYDMKPIENLMSESIEEIPNSGSKRLDEKITWSNAKWWELPLK